MYATPMSYEEFSGGDFSFMAQVRAFGPWAVWSAARDTDFLLFLVNEDSHEALLCEYEDSTECFGDMALLRCIPGGVENSPLAA
ncbi:MAG: hypothetical protein ABIY70_10095 [Capsulimonas sp.]|uniref:hypothetical protein n=1 Tax=Capsulimonas sp. TaxID=2494211 RepID=UPI003262DE88